MPLRWISRPAFALAVALVAVLACGREAPPPPPPPQVTVASVLGRTIDDAEEFTGRLEAVEVVEIRPRVSGYIGRVAFAEGKEVRRGDVLFEIDPRPYEAALARAEAELQRARTRVALATREVERAQRLVSSQAISREEFDLRTSTVADAEAAVRAAEAAVATARLDRNWTRVRSPIAGRVGRAEVTEGNLVQAGPPTATLLTTVVSVDSMYVYFDSDERTYLDYAALAGRGRRNVAQMGLANEEGFPHRGYIDFVDNQLNPRTGTIRARAIFTNRDRRFTPGLFARVRLIGTEPRPAALIQDRAVGTDQDRKFVLVLKPDSTVEYRQVRLGRIADGLRVVEEGLQPGDPIVVNGLQRIRPGMRVAAKVGPMTPDSASLASTSTH